MKKQTRTSSASARKLTPSDGNFESESPNIEKPLDGFETTPLNQATTESNQNTLPTDRDRPFIDQPFPTFTAQPVPTFTSGIAKDNAADLGFLHGIDVRNPEHLIFSRPLECLQFEIMGGVNLKHLDRLRATLKVSRLPQLSPVHAYRNTVDLYSDSQVKRYIREAAEKLEIGTTDITNLTYTLIEGLEKYRLHKREQMALPKQQPRIVVTGNDKAKALDLLKSPVLLDRIGAELKTCGLVEEEDNGLLLFLVFLTRHFSHPLHALVHGSSGSGKTNLLKTVIGAVPPEQVHITTALTENALFYPPYPDYWKHKILMIEDLDGSMSALYSMREFMSNGSISKDSTEMNAQKGSREHTKLVAEGPVCLVGATTHASLYEDNSNRSYLIHVNETYRHQQAVMEYQNREAAGFIDKNEREDAKKLLQNMQRMLDNTLEVRNPYQPDLMLPSCVFKPLRTNTHYIALIKAVTFLHQFQLEIKKDASGVRYIETTLDHIEWANRLCRESLLRKSDMLNGAQRTFFERLKSYLNTQGITKENNKGFYAKQVREEFRMHTETLKRNLSALVGLGLLSQVGFNRKLSFEYEVTTWDDYTDLNQQINVLDQKLSQLKETVGL